MLDIPVSKEILDKSRYQVEHFDFGKMAAYRKGDAEEQFHGIVGQNVVMSLFNVGDVDGSKGCDNGIDFWLDGLSLDVKTMGRTKAPTPKFTNNFYAAQDCFNVDAYIFCSFHEVDNILTICGWIDRKRFHERRFGPFLKGTRRYRDDGTFFIVKDTLYEIDNFQLMNIDSADDLKNQLQVFNNK